ncbi:hypothetical protein F5884DRAFT_102070 [Xylogone sp. PMI_703]|nr:hypothetical protein F5884DRAFT_102070 [Xylogone sp. PMI_703]
MSRSTDIQGWERYKDVIHELYITKGHPLKDSKRRTKKHPPDGIIRIMKERYGFIKTKAQYEKKFNEWGWKKYRKREDWEILARKMRKRNGKKTAIYIDGKETSMEKVQKEISRQGYTSFIKQFNQDQAGSPKTPPGMEICTPASQPLINPILTNLPTLQFHAEMQRLNDSFILSNKDPITLSTALSIDPRNLSSTGDILSKISSLFPVSALLEDESAEGLAIDKLNTTGFMKLTTFLISNKVLRDISNENLYQWFRENGGISLLKWLPSTRDPTTEALLETLFRCAIEATDIHAVRCLLKLGVNPNGHSCKHPEIGYPLSPLQFSCISGNDELAYELIQAGSVLDQPGTGWRSSILTLAIIGYENHLSQVADLDDEERIDESKEHPNGLLTLVNILLDAGADINVDIRCLHHSGDPGDTYSTPILSWSLDYGCPPLVAASLLGNNELVKLFIDKGANVMALTEKALRLYTTAFMV